MMEQMAALLFDQSDAGQGIGRQGRGPPPLTAPFAPNGFGRNTYGGRGGQGCGRGRGRGRGPPAFIAGHAPSRMHGTTSGRRQRILCATAPDAAAPPPTRTS